MFRLHVPLMASLLLTTTSLAFPCSPAGHSFVAIASLGKLQQTTDPEARKLAAILHKYRWVVYWAAEGPDTIQQARGYHFSHWFPLYPVDYEHPERFDREAAQPFFTALLKGAYDVGYGCTGEDVAAHSLRLVRTARQDWREVSLAFACGYLTHLLSDYFCHAPAKVWWDHSPGLREAVKAVAKSESYGVIQEFYAVMLWERFVKEYGVPENGAEDFASKLPQYHVDNGVLPYCGLACSKSSYAHWPEKVLEHVDPSKHDPCAAPMIHSGGAGLGRCVEHERTRVLAMVEHMGLSLDEAIKISDELTGWRKTYELVIEMIVGAWTQAAAELSLEAPTDEDVVQKALEAPSPEGHAIAVPAEEGAAVNLALHRDWAVRRYRTRDGEEGPVTGWGEKPSGARFDLGVLRNDGETRVCLFTDGPWLTKSAGHVEGTFVLQLPKTEHPIHFRTNVRLHGKKSKQSDGVTFRVLLTDAKGNTRTCFEQHTKSHEPLPVDVDLSEAAGAEVKLTLVSDAGPNDHVGWDWGAWVEPMIVVGAPQ